MSPVARLPELIVGTAAAVVVPSTTLVLVTAVTVIGRAVIEPVVSLVKLTV